MTFCSPSCPLKIKNLHPDVSGEVNVLELQFRVIVEKRLESVNVYAWKSSITIIMRHT